MMIDTLHQETVVNVEPKERSEPYNFTANDRCDSSQSERAMFRVTKGDAELLFCRHHFNKYQNSLIVTGWAVEADAPALKSLGDKLDVSPS